VRRVRAQVMSYSPRPKAVPTPLATVGVAMLDALVVTPSPTAGPAEALVALPNPTITPTPIYCEVLPQVRLEGLTHVWQTWNNCGPATLVMNLSYYGSLVNQADAGSALRTFEDDKNVSPEELAEYARAQGFNALSLINGDVHRLRLLLSNGIPVLIETWHEPEPDDGMGHYRLLVGYDEGQQEWIAYDSFDSKGVDPDQPYTGIRIPYPALDPLWRVFNRAYVLVYDDERAPLVEAILEDDLDTAALRRRALEAARAETQERPEDPFAWFNLGSDLASMGQFQQAATAYDRARQLGLPWRMLWYQYGPFQAYHQVGRYEEVLSLAEATLAHTTSIEEIYFWKGMAHNSLGDLESARQAWERCLELNPNFLPALDALASLGRS
jgi:tetratricopeptide (TPR) repeat protein